MAQDAEPLLVVVPLFDLMPVQLKAVLMQKSGRSQRPKFRRTQADQGGPGVIGPRLDPVSPITGWYLGHHPRFGDVPLVVPNPLTYSDRPIPLSEPWLHVAFWTGPEILSNRLARIITKTASDRGPSPPNRLIALGCAKVLRGDLWLC